MAPVNSPQSFHPPTPDQLAGLSPGLRLAFSAAAAEAYRRRLIGPAQAEIAGLAGPQTDDELLEAIEQLTGYHMPRVAVCTEHDHKAPAWTFCRLYFGDVHNLIWIGNRGGGKTTNSGFLHGAKNRWNPEYESAIAGAVEKQGYRAYAEFKRFTRSLSNEIIDSLLSKTVWANGSLTEVLGGTARQLNGPHPHLAQFDELELITAYAIFEEFLNMAQGDNLYPSQQLLTSTRKRATGVVQGLVKGNAEALKNGEEPPWDVHIFCVFETMRNVPNCRNAPENEGRPEEELCQCQLVRKGKWDDGTIRTFDQVCHGRAARADGFVHLVDAHKRFRTLSRATWEAQQECLTPDIEGMVHKWIKDKHRLQMWWPYPQFGPIYRGWDWGGRNPHAIVWVQRLSNPVALAQHVMVQRLSDGMEVEISLLTPVLSENDERDSVIILPEGALVQFDEIYGTRDELGEYSSLGFRAALRQLRWRKHGFPMVIAKDFCDPSGYVGKNEVKKATRNLIEMVGTEHYNQEVLDLLVWAGLTREDLEAAEIQVPSFKSTPCGVLESVGKHIEWGQDDYIYYVPTMCPKTDDEYDAYRWPPKKEDRPEKENPVEEDDHAMDAKRYLIWNVHRMDAAGEGEQPAALERNGGPEASPGQFAKERLFPDEAIVNESPVGVSSPGSSPYGTGRVREASYQSRRGFARGR